jgi:hypothetical protein
MFEINYLDPNKDARLNTPQLAQIWVNLYRFSLALTGETETAQLLTEAAIEALEREVNKADDRQSKDLLISSYTLVCQLILSKTGPRFQPALSFVASRDETNWLQKSKALGNIKPEGLIALLLHLEGFSYKEISQIRQIPPPKVKNLIFKTKKQLAKSWEGPV